MNTTSEEYVMNSKAVTDDQELIIRRQADEAVRRVLEGAVMFEFATQGLQAVIEGRLPGETGKKRDLADERRLEMLRFFGELGYHYRIPKPDISNREYRRQRNRGNELFYRPATSEVRFALFMDAVENGIWRPRGGEEDRNVSVGWEATDDGYWFLTNAMLDCPNKGRGWHPLRHEGKLLSLEEYVIMWHAMRRLRCELVDVDTCTWTRTRCKKGGAVSSGAVLASSDGNKVMCRLARSRALNATTLGYGGRFVERVGNASNN